MRLYFCSDLHASDRCWLKFLAAPKFYGADVIIIGGDITGKFIVPIIAQPGGTWTSQYMGVERRLASRDDVARLAAMISNAGSYPVEMSLEEYGSYDGRQERIDGLFGVQVLERVRHWVQLADERLANVDARCFVQGANDDFLEVDDVLRTSRRIEVPEGRVVDVDGFQMLSVGYGNPTPWNCPRDISEEELGERIERLTPEIVDMRRAIFNLHVPPWGSQLDLAPRLDADFNVVATSSGEPEMVPVGSTAVHDAIVRHQPLLGLHGHIHESKGIKRLGATIIANPGSEYQEGLLDGVLIDLDPSEGVVNIQLVTG
ncbi:MAG: putative phosphoesterase, ICC [Chloroflexi bacterium CSP1-4]|nr:MAG: putative phosphoesterase, ICC [Chloroflexi bacterium CSP1-4]